MVDFQPAWVPLVLISTMYMRTQEQPLLKLEPLWASHGDGFPWRLPEAGTSGGILEKRSEEDFS